jgi:hypothetical protein
MSLASFSACVPRGHFVRHFPPEVDLRCEEPAGTNRVSLAVAEALACRSVCLVDNEHAFPSFHLVDLAPKRESAALFGQQTFIYVARSSALSMGLVKRESSSSIASIAARSLSTYACGRQVRFPESTFAAASPFTGAWQLLNSRRDVWRTWSPRRRTRTKGVCTHGCRTQKRMWI